ncbi:hypothetical protein NDU88_005623 [Pleurodeles waltl]|uniref:Uncharacterized protein n=1 Tax=Pleurodeles waltl TaxID=8319 RepID=A0AAV7TB04_PLEWA|nr:hypothetical protein NDU88_005623 [Pleurodeles waltl]
MSEPLIQQEQNTLTSTFFGGRGQAVENGARLILLLRRGRNFILHLYRPWGSLSPERSGDPSEGAGHHLTPRRALLGTLPASGRLLGLRTCRRAVLADRALERTGARPPLRLCDASEGHPGPEPEPEVIPPPSRGPSASEVPAREPLVRGAGPAGSWPLRPRERDLKGRAALACEAILGTEAGGLEENWGPCHGEREAGLPPLVEETAGHGPGSGKRTGGTAYLALGPGAASRGSGGADWRPGPT